MIHVYAPAYRIRKINPVTALTLIQFQYPLQFLSPRYSESMLSHRLWQPTFNGSLYVPGDLAARMFDVAGWNLLAEQVPMEFLEFRSRHRNDLADTGLMLNRFCY